MWVLNFLPDWVFHLVLVIGIINIVVGVFLRGFPIIDRYQTPIVLLGVFLTVAGIWYSGGIAKDREYRERIAKLQLQVAEAEKKAAEANAKIEYVYVDRVKVVERVRYEVVSAIRENSNALDANCKIIPQAVDIINQAAQPFKKEGEKK